MQMKKRIQWFLIGFSGFVIASIIFSCGDLIYGLHHFSIMENRRSMLLYETDHQLLLKACRELSKQMSEGEIKADSSLKLSIIVKHDPNTKQLLQPIIKLGSPYVYVENDGFVVICMWPGVQYGVYAIPESYKGSISEVIPKWSIKLIDGLWYFDEDYITHPDHKKEVEKLLKERKIISE
jgi:hypothetical protein